jgi:D-3-phosphoglycerate dehydrogenase
MAEVDILVPGLPIVTAEMLARGSRLKAVLKHGVGVDNIDIAAATARKIPVCNAPGTNANAVVELVLVNMIALSRRLPMMHADMLQGTWKRCFGTEIGGKTLGIVGLGSIGKELAIKAIALGMRVIASDIYRDTSFAAKHGITFLGLEALLQESDYVSLHVIGGEGTENLIGAAELAKMKPSAFIINCARGTVLDLTALAAALAQGKLAGAAIDAYPSEPPDYNHTVFKSPNVIFTPHSGADTKESGLRTGEFTLANIRKILAGEKPVALLNPEIFSS